jgi:hypothetical protein
MLVTTQGVKVGTMSFASVTDAVTMPWNSEASSISHLLLKVLLNGISTVKIQQIFHKHFNIARHGKAPCRYTTQYMP